MATILNKEGISTKTIIFTCIVMYIVEVYFQAQYGEDSLLFLGAKWNQAIKNGEYYRLITYSFLHGNIIHLGLNSLGLYIFSSEVERYVKPIKLILVYFFTAWGAGLTSYVLAPQVSIGASGAVFGLIGFLCVVYYNLGKYVKEAMKSYKSMYTIAGINILISYFIPNIDNGAHIGGFISGVLVGLLLKPSLILKEEERKYIQIKNDKKSDVIKVALLFIFFTTLTNILI